MKLGKLLGMKGGFMPKLKLMPKMKDLTGIKPGEIGIPMVRVKRKRTSFLKIFKDT